MTNASAARTRPQVARAKVVLHGIVDRARFSDYHDEGGQWLLVNVPDPENNAGLAHAWFTIQVRMAKGRNWQAPKEGQAVRVVGLLRRRRGDGGDIFLEASELQLLGAHEIVLPLSHG